MENKKTLLVLDWSNLLFRSLFMNSLYSGHGGYNNMEDMKSFIYKFSMDVCSILNIFKPSNVVIATDSQHAWRKDILLGYKSNRQKSESINWDNVFKCSDDLLAILQKAHLHVGKVDHCEADDIAAMCKELVFEKYPDYNIIIVSADADIRQLIDFNIVTNQYCIVYNTTGRGKGTKRSLYVTKEFLDWYNKADTCDIFFETEDLAKQNIKSILQNNNIIQLVEANPNDVVLDKIFCGDDGDCVPSFYNWYGSTGKMTRITPGKEKKIRELIGINNVHDLLEGKSLLKPVFEKVCKIDSIDDIDFHERLIRQRTLVELNSSLFPTEIREYKDSLDYMINDLPPVEFWNIKAPTILAGTEYENANKKRSVEAEVFKGIEKYINSSNPLFPIL